MSRDIKRTIIKCGLCERQFSGIEDKTVTKIYNMHRLKAHNLDKVKDFQHNEKQLKLKTYAHVPSNLFDIYS